MKLGAVAAALHDRVGDVVQGLSRVTNGIIAGAADRVRSAAVAHRNSDRYTPSALEQYMQEPWQGKTHLLGTGESTTYLGRARLPGIENRTVYKPGWLENIPRVRYGEDRPVTRLRYGIPAGGGHLAARDVSAFRTDEALGFGRVPPTGFVDGPFGRGSNQLWVPSSANYGVREIARLKSEGVEEVLSKEMYEGVARELRRYPRVQREQMAVLDYIFGNTDRNLGNAPHDRESSLVAIDNTLTFPESPDSRFGIRSPFVYEFLGTSLSEEVMRSVRAVDLDRLRAAWADAGLSEKAINGAMDRLIEIRTHGMITGEAWPAKITTWLLELDTAFLPGGDIEYWPPPVEYGPPSVE